MTKMMMLYLDHFLCCLSLRIGVVVVAAAQMVESALIITHQTILLINISDHPYLRPWIPGMLIVWAVFILTAGTLLTISVLQERLNLTVIWMLVNIAFIFFFFIGVMSYLALGQWVIAVGYILALFFHLYASIVVFSYSHNLFILQTVRDLIPCPGIHSNPDLQGIEHSEPVRKSGPPQTPCPSPKNGPRAPPSNPAVKEVISCPTPESPATPPRRRLPPPSQITVFPRVRIPKPRPVQGPVQVQAQVPVRVLHSHTITLQT